MYHVLHNGRIIKTSYEYEEALDDAMNWLGQNAPPGTASLVLNQPYEYDDDGNYILITDTEVQYREEEIDIANVD